MRIKNNTLKAVRDFFDEELGAVYSSDEIRYYFYLCCDHFLSLSKTKVIGDLHFRISESMMLKFSFAVKDLKKNKPIQYILENCDFLGLSLRVTQDVLIPRPETEELTQKIILENKEFTGHILDICTGSGCIALALKKELQHAFVQGFDNSESAIRLAKKNAENYLLNVDFFMADLFTYTTDQRFDIIVSNPPYVLHSEKALMYSNVLHYEPHEALFVEDEKPLIYYQAIADFSKKHLNSGGKLYLEINEKFGNEISNLLKNQGFSDVCIENDFRGKERFVKATR